MTDFHSKIEIEDRLEAGVRYASGNVSVTLLTEAACELRKLRQLGQKLKEENMRLFLELEQLALKILDIYQQLLKREALPPGPCTCGAPEDWPHELTCPMRAHPEGISKSTYEELNRRFQNDLVSLS